MTIMKWTNIQPREIFFAGLVLGLLWGAPAQARLNFGVVPRPDSLVRDAEGARQFGRALSRSVGEDVAVRVFADEARLVEWMHRYREVDLGLFSREMAQRQPAGRFFPLGSESAADAFLMRQGIGAERRVRVAKALAELSLPAPGPPPSEPLAAPAPVPAPEAVRNPSPRPISAATAPIAPAAAPAPAEPRPTSAVVAPVRAPELTPRQEELRLQGVALARAGRYAEALEILAALHREVPDQPRVGHDYLTVLAWAEHDAEVVILADRMALDQAPRYVVEAVAKALRNQKWFEESAALYRQGINRFPDHLPFALGLAQALVDAGQFEEAAALAAHIKVRHSDDRAALLACLYVAERSRDHLGALDVYQRLLALDPDDQAALRGRIVSLRKMGANHLAAAYAAESPVLLAAGEEQRLRNDLAGQRVRWGVLPPVEEARRFAETDQALASIEDNLAHLDARDPAQRELARQARNDRLVALRDRYRMAEAVAEYRALSEERAPIPPYGLKAAGDALLYLERPAEARDLYLRVLAAEPGAVETRLALFYAYVELEDFPRALALVDQLSAEQAELAPAAGGSRASVSPHRLDAEVAAALARSFAGDLPAAQARFETLHDPAPLNPGLKRELGGVYAARGWPRRAQRTFRAGLLYAPEHRGLQTGLAGAHLDLREYGQAEAAIGDLYRRFPEDKQVQRLQTLWQIHTQRELRAEASYSDSTGADPASDELRLGTTLFSSPFLKNYRAFAGVLWSKADFPEGQGIYRRYGAGLEYRRRDFEGTAELTYNVAEENHPGVGLAGTWFRDDRWSFPFAFEILSRDTPVRALRHGVEADALRLGAVLRESEQRRWALESQVMDFSDGNLRTWLSGSLRQRLATRPHYRLDGIVELYASANDRSDVDYYSPESDASAALTLDNEWLLWRRYRRAFSHRLALTGGMYWQKDFGSDPIGSLLYEHIWQADYRFDLIYGVALHRRAFDGDPEDATDYYLRLLWRL